MTKSPAGDDPHPSPPSAPQQPAPAPGTPVPPPARPPAARRRVPTRLVASAIGAAVGFLGASGRLPFSGNGALLFGLGPLLGLNLHALLAALLSRPAGLAPAYASIGAGRAVGRKVWSSTLVTFRPLPLVLFSSCLVATDRPGLRWRLWWITVLVFVTGLAASAALILAGGAAAPLGWGMALIFVIAPLTKPRTPLSPAWILSRLPFGDPGPQLAEWIHDPATLAAARALSAGRLDAMRAALAGAGPSPLPQRRMMEAALALAEGRFDDSVRISYALQGQLSARPLRLAALQGYAAALACGVEAGHWAPADALPQFTATVAAIRAERPALLRAGGLGALQALVEGRPSDATKQVALTIRVAPESSTLANALLTRAAIEARSGQATEARASVAKAAALFPGLHRVAVMEAFLAGAPLHAVA